MANYNTYTITSVSFSSSYIKFGLNSGVQFSGGSQDYIYCVNRPPFNGYHQGDQVEIDLERTRYMSGSTDIEDPSIARPSVSSSSQQLVRRAQGQVSANPIVQGGREMSNRFTGETREERLTYNQRSGDYYYEYIEYTKK